MGGFASKCCAKEYDSANFNFHEDLKIKSKNQSNKR